MDVREKLVELLKEVVAIQECGFGDPRPTYETVASYLMSHGVTVQEWISVTERLPEEKANYVVYYKHAFCDDESHVGICICFYDGEEFEMDSLHKVTHWMPLPEPPKGE